MPALSRLIVNFEAAGALTFALGLLLLGTISMAAAEFLPSVQPIPATFEMPARAACLNGILIAALATGMFFSRIQGPAAALQAAYLSTWLFVAQLPQLCFGIFEMMRLASLLELTAIVAALMILAIGKDARSGVPVQLGRYIYASMLLVFALEHIQGRGSGAMMIPGWVPFGTMWPWLSAAANLAVGISFLAGIKHQLSGALLGIVYVLWVPAVHLPRLFTNPSDVREWTACALTLTLAGAAWLVSRGFEETCTEAAAATPDGGSRAFD